MFELWVINSKGGIAAVECILVTDATLDYILTPEEVVAYELWKAGESA